MRYRIDRGHRRPLPSDGRLSRGEPMIPPGAWSWPIIDKLDAKLQPVARQMRLVEFHDADEVEHIVRYDWMTPLFSSLVGRSARL